MVTSRLFLPCTLPGVVFGVFVFLLLLHVNCEHPCKNTDDILFEISDTKAFCYRNFGEGSHNRFQLLPNCTNWFHQAYPLAIHNQDELDFVLSNVTTSGKNTWTGLHKEEYTNECFDNVFDWDDPSDLDFAFVQSLPKNCLDEKHWCFYMNTTGGLNDMLCTSPDVDDLESVCYYQVPVCDSILSTNISSVCSGHGECLTNENCICYGNYYGEYCQSTIACNEVNYDDEKTCSGHGNCTYQDHCNCFENYFGQFCDSSLLDSKLCDPLRNETLHNGYCYKNFGKLDSSFYSFDLSEDYCSSSKSTMIPTTFYEHSETIRPHVLNILDFDEEIFIRNEMIVDQKPIWLGLRKNDSVGGSKLYPCMPENGYIWTDEAIDTEYAISKQSSVVCDSNQKICITLDPSDDPSFPLFWRDEYCDNSTKPLKAEYDVICKYEVPICYGVSAEKILDVCGGGNGVCIGHDNCTCVNQYFGSECDEYACFGVLNDPLMDAEKIICSGHGSCLGPDFCACEDGYKGLRCNISSCFGVYDNVCSGHGKCMDKDTCACEAGYGGEKCEKNNRKYPCAEQSTTTVISTPTNLTTSNRSYCYEKIKEYKSYYEAVEYCDSDLFFKGSHLFSVNDTFELTILNSEYISRNLWIGIQKNENEGSDPIINTVPSQGWGWSDNTSTTYIDSFPNGLEAVMDEQTKCMYKNSTQYITDAPCIMKNFFVCRTNLYLCDGIYSNNPSVCNGNGFCVADDVCECNNPEEGAYVNDRCELASCFGILSNDTLNVCSAHGFCRNDSLCDCRENYFGEQCNVTSCSGLWNNESSSVPILCNGKGDCVNYDDCSCQDNYYGPNCNITFCNGVVSTEEEVCSQRGECYAYNLCNCSSSDFFSGKWCEITTCFDVLSTNEENVCSKHGKCIGYDDCKCSENYYGLNCNITTCNNTFSNDSEAVGCVSQNGVCWPYEVCKCDRNGYFSTPDVQNGVMKKYCDLTTCFGVLSTEPTVCSTPEAGECADFDKCECNSYYSGTRCEVTTCNGTYSNDSSVCSGHGTCIAHDVCTCESVDYWGEDCEISEGPYWITTYKFEDCGNETNLNYEDVSIFRAESNYCYKQRGKSIFRSYNETTLEADFFPTSYNCTGALTPETPISFDSCLDVNATDLQGNNYYSRVSNFTFLRSIHGDFINSYILMEEYGLKSGEDYASCVSSDEPSMIPYPVDECIFYNNYMYVKFLLVQAPGKCDQIRIQNFTDSECTTQSSFDKLLSTDSCNPHPFLYGKYFRLGWLYEDNLCFPYLFPNISKKYDCEVCMDTCFGNPRFSDLSTCGGHGKCVTTDTCACDVNYFGEDCNITKCDDVLSNDTLNVCSSHGACGPVFETCSCQENYFGESCNVTICNKVYSNDTKNICSGSGTCTYFDKCDCKKNYFGEDCNVTLCDQQFSNLTSTCTKYGVCWPFDICSCEDDFFGKSCNISTCFGVMSNTSAACRTHGECWPKDTCQCDWEGQYFGPDCNHTFCHGIPTNITGLNSVCTDHGSCWPYDRCNCDVNYYGEKCNVTTCLGIFSNETSVCNTDEYSIDCWPFDSCNCKEDYFGVECNITTCYDKYSNDTTVCGDSRNSYGTCWPHQECKCDDEYFGEQCNVTTCYSVYSNVSRINQILDGTGTYPCTNKGTCWPFDHCNCDMNWYGDYCNITTCFGHFSNDSSSVCSRKGDCIEHDSCVCEDEYFGENCNITKCMGVWNNDSSVCKKHGNCDIQNQNCSCYDHYSGDDCGFFSCFNVSRTLVDDVCSENGRCIAHNICDCDANYTGVNCQFWPCFGRMNNMTEENGIKLEERVCSGHGECSDVNICNCSVLYPGQRCNEWSCDSIPKSDVNNVCHGNGICTDINTCVCYPGYTSELTYCKDYKCNEIDHTLPSVCSSRGTCVSPNKCKCSGLHEGEWCQTFSCGVDKNKPGTCSGHGKCIAPEVCECESGYTGDLCDYNQGLATVLGVTLPIVGVLFIGTVLCCICMIVVCFCFALIVFMGFFMVIISGFYAVMSSQRRRLKKLDQLKDFEHLLKEQNAEESAGDIAKIKINKQLFEIDYDDIDMVEIIGKGGSDSTVYRANWRNQEIAFKCFRTTDLCSSQENFEEFEREVSILSSVSHPNVIRFFGASIKPPRIGIVMEYCENGDLKEFLFRRFLEKYGKEYPFGQKIRMLKEIVMAMEYLHARNVIHRDLKLENILVDELEHCKIMDFGLSKVVDRISVKKTMRVGTSVYIAPEVVLHGRYNEMCDVYSFAIMMFIIVSGNLYPFGKDETCVELRVAQDPNFRPNIHDLDRFMEENPETRFLKRIVQVCWNHDPNRRISFKMIGSFLIKAGAVHRGEEDVQGEELTELENLNKTDAEEAQEMLKQDLTSNGGENQLFSQIQDLLVKNEELNKDKQLYDIKKVEYKERVEVAEAEAAGFRHRNEELEEENEKLRGQVQKLLRSAAGKRKPKRTKRERKKKAPPVPKRKRDKEVPSVPSKPPPKAPSAKIKERMSKRMSKRVKKPKMKPPPVPVDLTKRKMDRGGKKNKKNEKPPKKAPPKVPPAPPKKPKPSSVVAPPPPKRSKEKKEEEEQQQQQLQKKKKNQPPIPPKPKKVNEEEEKPRKKEPSLVLERLKKVPPVVPSKSRRGTSSPVDGPKGGVKKKKMEKTDDDGDFSGF